ncbi:hypothetical protein Agub_g2519 [Astrephomene gubernaculifera]|uniref:Uncharacterized protein n=1 Tax=Astrephomene gubernaculifera TaxID=47775 RepID=A0AAD3HIC5_9CHLO|nr:hypothetical protein Agub_g2519 [Astrephomene gubernaculifera]
MAALYGTTGGDDVSYSRTLNKLLKVDVEKPPSTGPEASKQKIVAAHGRTSSRRGMEATVGAVPTAGLQVHWWEPQGSTPNPQNWQQRNGASGPSNFRPRTSPQSPNSRHRHPSSNRYLNQYPAYLEDGPHGPDPPASFMRTPWTSRSTTRARRSTNPQRNSSEFSPPSSPSQRGADGGGSGGGAGGAANGGSSGAATTSSGPHLPARFFPSAGPLGRRPVHPQLRYLNQHLHGQQQQQPQQALQQQQQQQLQQQQFVVHQALPYSALPSTPLSDSCTTGLNGTATPTTAVAATATATAAAAVDSGVGLGVAFRSRGGGGCFSNFTYKPATNMVAEPAAAVVQRRERTTAAIGAARGDGGGAAPPAGAATAAAANNTSGTAGGGGNCAASQSPRKRSMVARSASPACSSQPYDNGGGKGVVRESFSMVAEGDGADGDAGSSGGLGGYTLGTLTEGGMEGSGYGGGGGWQWQMNGLRGSWPTADGGEGLMGGGGGGTGGTGSPYGDRSRPMTAPENDVTQRRGSSGRRRSGRSETASPSPFAPPQQLYMRAQEEEAAAAAAARDVADLYDTTEIPAQRISSLSRLSFATLRPLSPTGGADDATDDADGTAPKVPRNPSIRTPGDGGDTDGRAPPAVSRAGSTTAAPKGSRRLRASSGGAAPTDAADASTGGAFASAAEEGTAAAAAAAAAATSAGSGTAAAPRASRGSSSPGVDLQTSSSGAVAVAGDTNRTLQVGISVAALAEIVKVLGPSQQQASTGEVLSRWLLPATQATKCRFLDLILWKPRVLLGDPNDPGLNGKPQPSLRPERSWTGPPDFYVIHAWAGNFAALVAALQEHCASVNKSPATVRVWLDCMAVNHHPGSRDKKELAVCRHMLASGRRALLVMDAGAECLTRLWCLYEVWLVACVVPGASPGKLQLLNAGADWRTVADAFLRIDLSRAGVTLPEDRSKLLEDFLRATRSNAAAGGNGGSGGGAPGSPPVVGGGPGSNNPGAASALTLYLVGAALPKLSAAVRGAIVDATAAALATARRSARGAAGLLALLDAAERYAMIRCIGGGHVEAEEQLTEVVAAVFEATGAKPYAGPAPLSHTQLAQTGHHQHSGGGGPGGGGSAVQAIQHGGGEDAIIVNLPAGGDWSGDLEGLDALSEGGGGDGGEGDEYGSGGGGGDGGGGGAASRGGRGGPQGRRSSSETSGPYIDYGNDAVAAAMAAVLAPAGKMPHLKINAGGAGSGGGGGGGNKGAAAAAAAANVANLWRRRPAALAALAMLQVEHGRRVLAMTHASKALSFVPGLTLVRKDKDPNKENGQEGGDNDNDHNKARSSNTRTSLSLSTTAPVATTHQHRQSTSFAAAAATAAGSGGAAATPGAAPEAQASSYSSGGGTRGSQGAPGSPTQQSRGAQAVAAGQVAWKGAYWELANPAAAAPVAVRTIVMVSIVESACGRHEAAAQLALQAGLARAAALGPAHPATLAIRRAAVSHLLAADRPVDAHLLASALLREAVAVHGESHPAVGLCHGAVAQVLAAQNRPQQAFVSAQRGAELLASVLGRTHPATLDAVQICVDVLESVQEYGKALALMRVVVEGRGAAGATRASPASPAFLAPTNRLLHLRTAAALEDKAAAENNSSMGRRNLLGILRGLAKLEAELKAALMAVGGRSVQIQRDLEQVLLAQNKRYEAALLQKGELPLTRMAGEATGGGGSSGAAAGGPSNGGTAGGGGAAAGGGGGGGAMGGGMKPLMASGGGGPLRATR